MPGAMGAAAAARGLAAAGTGGWAAVKGSEGKPSSAWRQLRRRWWWGCRAAELLRPCPV